MDSDFKYELIDSIMTIKSCSRVSVDEYNMRCPLCGDSRKDFSKKRFYIKINPTNDSPILYNCFNCDSSGILTPDVLRSLDVADMELNTKLIKYNRESMRKIVKRMGINYTKLNVKIPHPKATSTNIAKKNYIMNRLGIDVSTKELLELKCVFSIYDFIKLNKIDKPTLGHKRLSTIDKDYVGFLTANNEFISFRDITNKNKYRYDKYTIIPDLPNTVKMYTIPNSIDILSPKPIYVNIAEGAFDILGIYYHINNKNKENNLYVAVCGSGFMNVVKYYMKLGFVGSNIVYNIYSDSDHPVYFYNKIIQLLKPWGCKINIYYNAIEKDYGVRKEEIELYKKYSG